VKTRYSILTLAVIVSLSIAPSYAASKSKPKVDYLKLACSAWRVHDATLFTKFLVQLQMQGSKYSQFVKVGFEDMKIHGTDPSLHGADAVRLNQEELERQRILHAYCG
jgi:hypothetical protein